MSKDNDFRQLAFLRGPPPKVVWLNVGNSSTKSLGELMVTSRDRMRAFELDPDECLLVLVLETTE